MLEKTLESILDCNQSIWKEISPEYSLEELNLKLQYFGLLMWRADSLEKILMLGKIEAGKERADRGLDGWMASLSQWAWMWASSRDGKGQGCLVCCSPWVRKESDTTEQLNNNNTVINASLLILMGTRWGRSLTCQKKDMLWVDVYSQGNVIDAFIYHHSPKEN